jgi:hypothetical protein
VDLLLDTTSGLSTAQLTFKLNGVTIGSWTGDGRTYNSVLFGRGLFGVEEGSDPSGNATVSDITVTMVPEPASLVIGLCAGAVGLVTMRAAGHRRRFSRIVPA